MKTKPYLCYLEWHDACSQSGWHSKDQLQEFIDECEVFVRQVGWIVEETPKQIILASRLDTGTEPYEYGMLQKIPTTWIRKRKRIKIG